MNGLSLARPVPCTPRRPSSIRVSCRCEGVFQEPAVGLALEQRVAGHARLRRASPCTARSRLGAAAQPRGIDVDLGGADVIGQELVVREVGTDEQQQIRAVDTVVRRAVTEQSGHPDVERVVVLDPFLAAQANARSAPRPYRRARATPRARPRTPAPAKIATLSRCVDRLGERLDVAGIRNERRAAPVRRASAPCLPPADRRCRRAASITATPGAEPAHAHRAAARRAALGRPR